LWRCLRLNGRRKLSLIHTRALATNGSLEHCNLHRYISAFRAKGHKFAHLNPLNSSAPYVCVCVCVCVCVWCLSLSHTYVRTELLARKYVFTIINNICICMHTHTHNRVISCPSLNPSTYNLQTLYKDNDNIPLNGLMHMPSSLSQSATTAVTQITEHLKHTYCGYIGAEFSHLEVCVCSCVCVCVSVCVYELYECACVHMVTITY